MEHRWKSAAAVLFACGLSVLAGVVFARRHELWAMLRGESAHSQAPSAAGARLGRTPSVPRRNSASDVLTAREVRILGADSTPVMEIGTSGEGGPVISITNSRKSALVQLAVHGNGFPMVVVSDGAVRNFGLGRVDGRNASPILVFRRDDVVRCVFGLSMTEAGRPAFLVQYTSDDQMHEVIGGYCGRPDRACTN
jgi:hypothetical protein